LCHGSKNGHGTCQHAANEHSLGGFHESSPIGWANISAEIAYSLPPYGAIAFSPG
jgi:hypothetical protein